MGSTQSTTKEVSGGVIVGPNSITNPTSPILLLASPSVDIQSWRIVETLNASQEEREINRLIAQYSSSGYVPETKIIYYGMNSTDKSPDEQLEKLEKHGLKGYIYRGGLLEWSLLRECFGEEAYGMSRLEASGDDSSPNVLDFLPKI